MVTAKKHLGQHFLRDESIARNIVGLLSNESKTILEIGPGTGVLTKYLMTRENTNLHIVDLDAESIAFLKRNLSLSNSSIYEEDFLRMDLSRFGDQLAVIGNFPYNISSQILFKVLEHKDRIPELVGMFQKEVAERVASSPGNKNYGIISVLLQAYYNISYEFTVSEEVFDPPPKVKSGVIRMTRNSTVKLPCDEQKFKSVIKMAFNQRRKTLRNSLKGPLEGRELPAAFRQRRPEELSVDEFIELTEFLS
ncbi:MAG: 16S rRNA (adenine(1518)-N(6)/adenine(1519)-N(6))-dimethyltransferase RsmA [Flavobacteriales bacterium]|nr:16S rRNA (adenine(1518)-N(6)/adenine(1519)-N(6))-dimethyltransferase RsmA [Flavobacteriales bacterium]